MADHFTPFAPRAGRVRAWHPPQPGIIALLFLAWFCALVAACGLLLAAWEQVSTPAPGIYLVSRS